jgi:hypothetical protein
VVWQIIDIRSNLLDEFDDETSALAAVREMIAEEPDVTDDIGLLGFDDDGKAITLPALTGDALRAAAEAAPSVRGPRAA